MVINYDKNPKILNNFLNYLLGIENYSIRTVRRYNYELLSFFYFIIDYMKLNITVKKINTLVLFQVKRSDIIAFLIYCGFTKNNSPSTRQGKLSDIRTFYHWLFSITPGAYVMENPTNGLPSIEGIRRLPKYLKLDEAKKIQEIFTLKNTKYYIRNNAIISTFLSTGARVSELANANIRDVNFENKTIRVIGKGNKERTLYLNELCLKKLKQYFEQRNRNKQVLSINAPLFLNKNGDRLGICGIENICKKAFKLMGLNENAYTTHTLRHTAATIMYAYVTQDILVIKKFLGHESITSTQIYTHTDNKYLKEAVSKNPLNDFIVDLIDNKENREEEGL